MNRRGDMDSIEIMKILPTVVTWSGIGSIATGASLFVGSAFAPQMVAMGGPEAKGLGAILVLIGSYAVASARGLYRWAQRVDIHEVEIKNLKDGHERLERGHERIERKVDQADGKVDTVLERLSEMNDRQTHRPHANHYALTTPDPDAEDRPNHKPTAEPETDQ